MNRKDAILSIVHAFQDSDYPLDSEYEELVALGVPIEEVTALVREEEEEQAQRHAVIRAKGERFRRANIQRIKEGRAVLEPDWDKDFESQ